MTTEVDILSDEFIREANTELAEKPCPACGAVGTASVERKFVPSRAFSLAGMQDKLSGSMELILFCSKCGTEWRLHR